MRALVIGGTGWVGSAVVHAFEQRGIDVVTMSRSGRAFAGEGVRGDVQAYNLGLSQTDAAELQRSVTHIVSTFGSVDWGGGPRLAMELHGPGTRAALRFAEQCPRLEKFVHLSSVLVLGRRAEESTPIVDELELGQSFRSWYEYAKYVAERELRANTTVPWRAVRVGGIVGTNEYLLPSPKHGIMAVVPLMLRGYPMHLKDHGRFPCYPTDVMAAGEVLARAALDEGSGDVWTYFDHENPSLAEVFTRLCSPWGVVPRIVDMSILNPVARLIAERLGLPREILEYTEPWPDIPVEVLNLLPADLPRCPPGYIEATGKALMQSNLAMSAI
jgi:nucleoside-diphosphate-sugar epimerase